ncbi:SlyX family protein [Pseudaeromonas sharmana]|uniref:Protein SlyX homolog n=1 Tax=Pseudaeromonas sharmana TaxID=328412 RepID=A0ABV8CIL3_9GAMM
MSDILLQRLDYLETRVAFQEHALEQLSEELAQQQKVMERMRQQMDILIQKMREQVGSPVASQAEETPPPHY